MEFMQILMVLLGIACSVLGWFGRALFNAVQQLRKDLSTLEVKIGTDYIRFDRLHEALDPILESLRDIKITLRDKADKNK